ncbi:MAG TPA: hypothetical protein GXX72_01530 [Clostridiaceae bacterium]|nr:hypothetical protein [Clostridiaceae bacterium]
MKEQQTNGKVIVVDHIDKDNYKEYIGKTVKVTGDVDLSGLGLTKIPINFTEVGGDFICALNELYSLKGSPSKVGGSFYCFRNKLSSLEGAPRKVGRDFNCWGNPLKSTKGKPEYIGGEFIS